MLFLNVDYDALHFHKKSLKIYIFKVLFLVGGRGSQKEYSVYAIDNVDNSGRPLSWHMFIKPQIVVVRSHNITQCNMK